MCTGWSRAWVGEEGESGEDEAAAAAARGTGSGNNDTVLGADVQLREPNSIPCQGDVK